MNKITLGSKVKDEVTGIEGQITHFSVTLDRKNMVYFRPCGLNPDTGEMAECFWIDTSRISGFDASAIERQMPVQILGTRVSHIGTGFSGIAIEMVLHPTGCTHVVIQPPGINPKTNTRYKTENIDPRELEGPAVPAMNETEKLENQRQRPSPTSQS